MNPVRVTLSMTDGTHKGQEYVFDEPARCLVGRAEDCDIQFPKDYEHSSVSRHHCILEIDPPAVRVRDLGSRNGTYVNGEKIGRRRARQAPEEVDLSGFPARELKDGDEVRLANVVLEVGIVPPSDKPGPGSHPMYSA